MSDNKLFKIGINIFLVKDNSLLLGKRKNAFGAGDWGLPGGHLEFGESMVEAGARELFEETGLTASSYTFANMVNDPKEDTHRLQIAFVAEGVVGEPELKEPEKCEEWRWFKMDSLPDNLFISHQKQIMAFINHSGNFVDSK